MTGTKIKAAHHLTEEMLAGFLDNALTADERRRCGEHLAVCPECLSVIVCAYESVENFRNGKNIKRKISIMKKINIYLFLAITSFTLSFITPRYFLQLLTAAMLLGAKWIVDSKSAKMLVMIYEAWKNGGEKEASRILETLDSRRKNRF